MRATSREVMVVIMIMANNSIRETTEVNSRVGMVVTSSLVMERHLHIRASSFNQIPDHSNRGLGEQGVGNKGVGEVLV